MTITSRQNHFRIVAKHSQKCLVAWTTKMDNRPFGKMSSDDMVIAPPELMQQEIRVNDFRQLWTIEYVDHGDGGMETLSKGKPPRARIVHSGTGHALGDDVVSIVTLPSKESDSGRRHFVYLLQYSEHGWLCFGCRSQIHSEQRSRDLVAWQRK
jgi:hypothetical protein